MNTVLVDPAALEEAAKWLEIHSSSSGSAEAFAAEALREAIAQPAEAEGVDVRKIVVDSLVGMIAGVTRMIPPADQPLPDFIQAPVDRAVERINAALSAVTAERDQSISLSASYIAMLGEERLEVERLSAEVEALRKVIRAALYYIPEHKHDLREIMSAAMAAKEA